MITLKEKTKSELENLNSKNLLAYYKAERKRFYSCNGRFICECCGEYVWDLYEGYSEEKKLYTDWNNYLKLIRSVLNTKGHVEDVKKEYKPKVSRVSVDRVIHKTGKIHIKK